MVFILGKLGLSWVMAHSEIGRAVMGNWSMADLAEQRDNAGTCHVALAEGDTAPLPGTTKRHLKGPGWVIYQFSHGGASVELKGMADGMVTYGPQPK